RLAWFNCRAPDLHRDSMRIHLVRHAQSNGNATGDYSTDTHDALSPSGLEQAGSLADRLRHMELHAIYCSPLKRAMQTIEPYARTTRRKVEIWPELAEACWQEERRDDTAEPEYIPSDVVGWMDADLFRFRSQVPQRPCESETYQQGL